MSETIAEPGSTVDPEMDRQLRRARVVSYVVLILVILFAGVLRLGTPLLSLLFSYYILKKLSFLKHNWLKVGVFSAFVALACTALAYTVDQTVKHLPNVADKAIPAIIHSAQRYGLTLPFSDWDSLKDFGMDSVKGELRLVGVVAKNATKQFVFLIIGIVIATSLFLTPFAKILRDRHDPGDNLYALYGTEIAARFKTFFSSFGRVMGAQLVISGINTTFTAIFILLVGLPYAVVGIGVTFLCGLLPIVGNLMSNSVLVAIGFTVSPQMAFWALLFLVVLHKMEYFLNSKIIGTQIKNPVWLTLIGLILGERLMGITGMILAPVILDYIRVEASRIRVGTVENTE